MWNYLKFMVHLWAQDQDDDDGIEQYVRSQLTRSYVEWFPDGVCMAIRDDDEKEGRELDVEEFQKEMLGTLERRQDDNNEKMIKEIRDMLDSYLKQPKEPRSPATKRSNLAGATSPAMFSGATSPGGRAETTNL
jgi:hypothetical protein